MPARKKPRKKVVDLDEDTMMALALSSSLLEQERGKQKVSQAERESLKETTAPNTSKSPALKWKPNAGRSKKKKGGIPRPPPLLLVQGPGAALARIQERVSDLLLSNCALSPSTPTRCTSSLLGWSGAAPLWQKSALISDFCLSDYYAPELRDFIVPQESTKTIVPSVASWDKTDTPVQHLKIRTPVAAVLPSPSQTGRSSPAVSTPGKGQLPGCSQALQDLIELAEDGMTLTQYGYSTTELTKDQQTRASPTSNLPSSGFVVLEEDEHNNDCVSGFLPEIPNDNPKRLPLRTSSTRKEEDDSRQSLHLSKLALDLGAMVNNPQLSDLQLQVDSGEVYFAHSFMVYARCPLLAEMIHESGFGVQEEETPAAQRVLLNDVPGQAVFALLQYLYTAHCSFPSSLRQDVLELASRFDLKDLQAFCQLQDEAVFQSENSERPNTQTDEAFIELLRSMWNDEDAEDDGTERNSFNNSEETDDQPGDGEMEEEQVNEDELVEIYEFAATQKKRGEEKEADDRDLPETSASPTKFDDAMESGERHVNASLDRSYHRLFSESWGEFEGKDCSNLPEPSSHLSARPLSSEMSARTLLQSSASVIDKHSPSPPPNAQNLPFAGVSPGLSPALSQNEVSLCGGGDGADDILKKSKNYTVKTHDAPAVYKPKPSQTSPRSKEPELVVLSDSSDDMDIDLTQSSNSPLSPNGKHFTDIKEQNTPDSDDLNSDKTDGQPPDGEVSLVDCSAEISWLVPSTPVQPEKSVRTSSSQTKSSICRTRLFPKCADSMPQSFSSSKPSFSSSETSGRKSSLELTRDKNLDFPGFVVPQSPFKYSHLGNYSSSHTAFSKQDTPLPIPAYSSTPVQTETLRLPPASSHTDRTTPSPEKAEIFPSFHLSPLSEKSSSSPSKTNSKSYGKSRLSEGCNTNNSAGDENARLAQNNPDRFEAEGGESSFRQSFIDEPPMAFNDSWGLDACAENPCFSLKLDDSEGSDCPGNIRTSASTTAAPVKRCDVGTSTFESSSKTSAISPPEVEPAQDLNNSLLDSNIWVSWEEEDEEKDTAPPLSERLKSPVQYKTPISKFKKREAPVPITPMPHYSDMDTPELKNKLNKFGVRPLPKRQMVLKLKEIHQYTHQLTSSESEDEAPSAGQTAQAKVPVSAAVSPTSCAMAKFKKPTITTTSPMKTPQDDEPLSASQGSNTSTAESERSNPEIVQLSDGDSDSDGGISASQSASRLQDRLEAVRTFILSDSSLYNQILQYQPLVLSQLQQQLKAKGIQLGVTKLADYLDSQCITFTTAKPGQAAPSRRRVKKTKAASGSGMRRKKASSALH
ncbi:structure-specific endonuclease subunit SLX4 [Eucyclogobius newberryi]|uniref:structure-specific endonuclease subunit SLX4 n=1 Tax=Eucyclogobius newberryi TaxID=166745 RepID=UPI003B59CE2A